jgi:phosphate transport system substrate-binding protein
LRLHLVFVALAVAALHAIAFAQAVNLTGAGSTFAAPLYSSWTTEFQKTHPNVRIAYQPIGSGAGIHQLLTYAVDFGATDGPMTDTQMAIASSQLVNTIFHFPTAIGADVPTYNIPGISVQLNFTPEALAGIFLGTITRWNDPAIQLANPAIKLPGNGIVVVHRSDGSGTTYVWADYLAKISPDWKTKVGVANSIEWPVGIGGQGNEGVANVVKGTMYSIGYVELTYAMQKHMPYGKVRNSAGFFVEANLDSVKAAAASVPNMPADFRVSITNASARNAYPISSFTWLLIKMYMPDKNKGAALKSFLIWGLTDGQSLAEPLFYARVPQSVVDKEMVAIKLLRY